MNKILRIFRNTNMANQHDGLQAIASRKGVDLNSLQPGEHVIFLNHIKTLKGPDKIKWYSAGGLVSYKRNNGNLISLGTIEKVLEAFDVGGKFEWNKAERKLIEEQLAKLNLVRQDDEPKTGKRANSGQREASI